MSHPIPPYRVSYLTHRELGEPRIAWDSVRVVDAKGSELSKLDSAKVIGANGMETVKENPLSSHTWLLIGGGVVAALGFLWWATRLTSASTITPATTGPVASPVTTITPGATYEVLSTVPTNVARASIPALLAQVGWTAQVVYYPGDPIGAWPTNLPGVPTTPIPNVFVFQGTYAGATASAQAGQAFQLA